MLFTSGQQGENIIEIRTEYWEKWDKKKKTTAWNDQVYDYKTDTLRTGNKLLNTVENVDPQIVFNIKITKLALIQDI